MQWKRILASFAAVVVLSGSNYGLAANAVNANGGMEMEKIVQTAGRDALGEFAPEFAHYNDDVLFGENWNNA